MNLDMVRACVLSRFSRVQLFTTLWTTVRQAPLSMGFVRQEDWSGLPCPPPRGLPDPGTELASLKAPALAGEFFITSTTCEALGHADLNLLILKPLFPAIFP